LNPPKSRNPLLDISLSVFFPCYNEQDNVQRVCAQAAGVLDELVTDWEIILVNDGSADRTGDIIDRLAARDARICAVHHERNGGYGMALRSGFAAASKEYVFYSDGDGQFDMSELGLLLARRDEAEIVSGYRRKRQDPWPRRLNGACWSWLVQRVLRFRCRDVDSAFKLYRREIFDNMNLRSTGALIDAEVLARATRAGCRIVTVPVTHLPRQVGEQTGAKFSVVLKAFGELWRLRRQIIADVQPVPAKRVEEPVSAGRP
jgi:glycosyltransferase involved in cell wall biosynthesis